MQDKTGTCLSFCPTIMSFMLFRQRGSACAADIVLHAGYLQDRYPSFCLHFLRAMYLPYPCNHMLARCLIFLRCLLVLTTSDLFSQANNILFFLFFRDTKPGNIMPCRATRVTSLMVVECLYQPGSPDEVTAQSCLREGVGKANPFHISRSAAWPRHGLGF